MLLWIFGWWNFWFGNDKREWRWKDCQFVVQCNVDKSGELSNALKISYNKNALNNLLGDNVDILLTSMHMAITMSWKYNILIQEWVVPTTDSIDQKTATSLMAILETFDIDSLYCEIIEV